MEQELRFGLDLCRLATFEAVFSCSLKKLKKKFRLKTFSIVSCFIKDPSPRDFSIMTLPMPASATDTFLKTIIKAAQYSKL